MPDVSGSIVVTDQAGASSPSAGSLAGLRAFGSSDAVLGLERRTGALLEAMVARQRILDDVSADIAARREQARVAHDRAMAAIRQRRTDESERIERDARLAIEAAEETHRSRATDLEMRRVRKLSELQSARDEDLLKLTRGLEEALLMAEAMREAGEEAEKRKTRELGERLARAMDEARSLEEEAKAVLLDQPLLQLDSTRVELTVVGHHHGEEEGSHGSHAVKELSLGDCGEEGIAVELDTVLLQEPGRGHAGAAAPGRAS